MQGHVKSIRSFKNIGFIDLSDGTTAKSLSVVFSNPKELIREHNLKVGQSLKISGQWLDSNNKQGQEFRYDPEQPQNSIEIIGNVPENYPIQKKVQTLQFLRGLPTLRHRTSTLSSVLRFRSKLESKFMKFFDANEFTKVAPPLITSSDCEGGGEQFRVQPAAGESPDEPFFGKEAFLTVSTQLHLEVLSQSLNRVWTLSPSFRAEDSNTNRHLSEFWMLEAEVSYVDEINQLTGLVEAMIRDVVSKFDIEEITLARFDKEDRINIQKRWQSITESPKWLQMTYTQALEVLNEKKYKKEALKWGDSILTEDEKWLAGPLHNSPLFITDYPLLQKPFYMPLSKDCTPERPTVACFDLIFPEIGEIVGGSLREHNYERLVEEMKRRGMNMKDMEWYLSLRENGTVPHGGFGLGFERLVSYLAGLDNVKDVAVFPRAPGLCSC